MTTGAPPTRPRPRLLLLGGGHAQVQVLAAIAREDWPAADITLVTPFERQFYSGMLPGWMAGRYTAQDCVIPLRPWAERAGAQIVLGRAVALDAQTRQVTVAFDDGRTERLAYDLLSIDTGSEMHADTLPGVAEHGVLMRPLEHFLPVWREIVNDAAQHPLHLAVVGSGAAGVELAMAARQALPADRPVTLVEGRHGLMAGFPAGVRQRVARHFARLGIARVAGGAAGLDAEGVVLGRPAAVVGDRLRCDAVLVATGGQAPRWLAGSGLALDAAGRIATGPTLRSLSHPAVFAAGDVAARPDHPHARSGVYAVRAGPPLARNLRRALAGDVEALEAHTPQSQALYLLACGDGRAIASRGRWSAEGRWVHAWKDHIDRAFIARWQAPSADATPR